MSKRKSPAKRKPTSPPREKARPLWKRILFPLAAVLFSLVGVTLAGELLMRLFSIRPERYDPPRWLSWNGTAYQPQGEIGWGHNIYKNHSRFLELGVQMGEHAPGSKFRSIYATDPRGYFKEHGGIDYKINSHGMRGPEISRQKPPETLRILGLGDSFMFGQGVHDKDTFLRRLERRLNEDDAIPQTVECLNTGVQGYNTRDQVVYFEHLWLKYEPDLVVIAFYLNDAYSDYTFLNHGQALSIYDEAEGIYRYSYLADFIHHRWVAWQQGRKVRDYYHQAFFADAARFLEQPGEMQVDWPACRDALSRAVQLAAERELPICLVIFPEFYGMQGEYPFVEIHELVASTAQRLGLPVLDLLSIYRGHADSELWVHPSDHHPNEIAHEMAADAIEEFLRASGLLEQAQRQASRDTSTSKPQRGSGESPPSASFPTEASDTQATSQTQVTDS